MSFPIKMNVPQYTVTVPSTQEKVSFRPFLVGEQKSMMLAMATEDADTIVNAIKNIISICSFGKVDVNKATSFDLEYLFLQLRARSIGETVFLNTQCRSCDTEIRFKVDISNAAVDFSGCVDKKITLGGDIGVMMRYPTLEDVLKVESDADLLRLTAQCIESVWDAEDVVSASDYQLEDMVEFVQTLTVEQFSKVSEFIRNIPSVRIKLPVKCHSCGTESTVSIEGLESFFG